MAPGRRQEQVLGQDRAAAVKIDTVVLGFGGGEGEEALGVSHMAVAHPVSPTG
jgi:hypothetical protein